MKNSFILYHDYRKHLKLLTDEEKGQLLMALLDYSENGVSPDLSGMALMAFSFIQSQLDRDNEKWETSVEQRRKAGKKSADVRKDKTNESQRSLVSLNENKRKATKSTDNVTVNVTDTDNVTENANVNDTPPCPPLGKVREQGEQSDISDSATTHAMTSLEQRFIAFWAEYPRKKCKETARRAWTKIKPNADLTAEIIKAVCAAKNTSDWTKENGRFIPYPATWLNAHGWEDELITEVNNAECRRIDEGDRNNDDLCGFGRHIPGLTDI